MKKIENIAWTSNTFKENMEKNASGIYVTRKNYTKDLDNLQLLGVINVLCNDYTRIYSVRRSDHHVQIFRFADRTAGVRDFIYTDGTYEPVVDTYIKQNVFIEDQSRLRRAMEFDNVCERLQKVPQFVVHYRVLRNGEIHYYYVKMARIGEADSFDTLVVAIANEDTDVHRNEMNAFLKPGGTAGRRKLLIVEDNELNREILTELLQDDFDILTGGEWRDWSESSGRALQGYFCSTSGCMYAGL